ncbi:MAG: class I tRNA ligase family protein, partial [Candidatus Thorarchaeota archaeon]
IPDPIPFKKLTPVDQWILAQANSMVERIVPECDLLDFHKPAIEIRGFTWNFFADHVLEMIKGRSFNTGEAFSEDEQKSAWFTLHEVLKIISLALAPMIPFITDRIYRDLYDEKGIHRHSYPSYEKSWKSELIRTNSGFWKFKRETGLSLRQGLPEAYISEDLKPWAKDLQAMHGVEKIRFGKPKDDRFVEVTHPESEDTIYLLPPTTVVKE